MAEMTWRVEYTERAIRQFRKLDPSVARILKAWIDKNLAACEDPRAHGKALTGNHRNKWRYRIGDYRLLADIQEDRIVILILEVGHRREVYE